MYQKKYTNLGEETREFIKFLGDSFGPPTHAIIKGTAIPYSKFLSLADRVDYKRWEDDGYKVYGIVSADIAIVFERPEVWLERTYNGKLECWCIRKIPIAYAFPDKEITEKDLIFYPEQTLRDKDAKIRKD